MLSINILYISFALGVSCVLGVKQQIILYDSADESGEGVILSGKYNDLSRACFTLRTNYYCGQGIWILYEFPNYDYDGENEALVGDAECSRSNLPNGYQSIRYLGAPDTNTVALSIYEERYASGDEHYFTGVATDGPVFPSASLALTGWSNWTLFTERDFQGTTYCLESTEPYTYIGTWGDTYPSQVGSVLRGCDRETDHKIVLPRWGTK